MPTSIAIAIARQIGADPADTERVLDHLVQDIRHEVARDGACAVPGLGTFRLFEGTIAFEPERGLAMAVNHRYAGLEPLLVNAADLTAPERRSPAPEEPAYAAGTLDEAAGAPAAVIGTGLSGGLTAAGASADSFEEQEREDAPVENGPESYELPEWSATPAMGWASAEPDPWTPPDAEEIPSDADFGNEEAAPVAQEGSYVPSAPSWNEPEGEPEQTEPHATEPEEAPVEWTPADAFSRLDQYEPPQSEPEPEPYSFEQYAPQSFEPPPDSYTDAPAENAGAAFQLPPEAEAEPAESAFYKLWDDQNAPSESVSGLPAPSEEPEPYELRGFGMPQEPEASYSLPKASWEAADETPEQPDVPDQAAVYPDRDETVAIPPVTVDPTEVIAGTAAMPTGTEPVEWEQPVPPAAAEPVRKRSGAPWLVAAVALIAVAAALWFFTRPAGETVPSEGDEIAQNQTPAEEAITEPEPPTDSSAQVIVPAPIATPEQPPAVQDNVSPLRRTGGIDASAGGFTLVVASVPSRTTADAVAQRYREQGYATAIFYGALGGVTRYRVGVGQFSDDRSVESQLNDLPDAFPQDAWPMAIRDDMEVYQ